jgi:hypothetical protein
MGEQAETRILDGPEHAPERRGPNFTAPYDVASAWRPLLRRSRSHRAKQIAALANVMTRISEHVTPCSGSLE